MSICDNPLLRSKFEELDGYISTLNLTSDVEFNRSNLIQVLHKAQHIFGYLPEEVQRFVAKKLNIHSAEVYGVVSFYSYFTMKMKGKYKISVCMGTACYVKGAQAVLEALEDELSIKPGETTDDGRFSLDILRCIGACGIAPVMLINEKAYGHITPDEARKVLKEYSKIQEAK